MLMFLEKYTKKTKIKKKIKTSCSLCINLTFKRTYYFVPHFFRCDAMINEKNMSANTYHNSLSFYLNKEDDG